MGLSKKKLKKLIEKKCYFCDCDNLALLDIHRIKPGRQGGKYSEKNTVVVCANCHRKCHADEIKILGRYYSTAGYVLHCIIGGEEIFL